MKKTMLKPEIDFIKFSSRDIITTSGEGGGESGDITGSGDTFTFSTKLYSDTVSNAHDSKLFSSGVNSLWNREQ